MPRKTYDGGQFNVRPPSGFNEAAARCHGKHHRRLLVFGELVASMRPRPDATENDAGDGAGRTAG